jgi:hypothetical protein
MLPKGFLGDLRLGDRHYVTMLTQAETGIEQALLSTTTQLRQACCLDPPRRPTVEHVEWCPRHSPNARLKATAARSNSVVAINTLGFPPFRGGSG